MRPRPNPLRLLMLTTPLLLLAPPASAGTPMPTEPRTADIEIVDTAFSKNAQSARFTLAFEETGSPAVVSLTIDGFQYRISVRCGSITGGKLSTSLDVRRADLHPGAPLTLSSTTDVALGIDQKKTVLSVLRPDGTRAEISVRVH